MQLYVAALIINGVLYTAIPYFGPPGIPKEKETCAVNAVPHYFIIMTPKRHAYAV